MDVLLPLPFISFPATAAVADDDAVAKCVCMMCFYIVEQAKRERKGFSGTALL